MYIFGFMCRRDPLFHDVFLMCTIAARLGCSFFFFGIANFLWKFAIAKREDYISPPALPLRAGPDVSYGASAGIGRPFKHSAEMKFSLNK